MTEGIEQDRIDSAVGILSLALPCEQQVAGRQLAGVSSARSAPTSPRRAGDVVFRLVLARRFNFKGGGPMPSFSSSCCLAATLGLSLCLTVTTASSSAAQPATQSELAILQQPLGDRQPGDAFGQSVAAHDNFLVVGAPGDDERGVDAGAAYVFVRRGLTWEFEVKLSPPTLLAGDAFGSAVAISGSRIVVGAPGDDRRLNESGLLLGVFENRGAAYLFERSAGTWSATRMEPQRGGGAQPAVPVGTGSLEPGAGDGFGSAVSMSATHIAIGAPGTEARVPDSGAVYVKNLADGGWIQFVSPSLNSPAGPPADLGRFGTSVDLFEGDLFVGEPSTGAGGAVYHFDGFTEPSYGDVWQWVDRGRFPGASSASSAGTGASVAGFWVGATRATVPADPSGPASGVVWQWADDVRITPLPIYPATGRDAGMRFGTSVALSSTFHVFVGSVRTAHAGPAVPVMRFERVSGAYVQRAFLNTTAQPMGSDFGVALDVSSDDVFVGSPVSDESPGGFVAVYLLDADGDGMGDTWETAYGLNPGSAVGVEGAAGDKDGDGVSNIDEFAARTHPTANAAFSRYFAEGATTGMFGTWLFLANPGASAAHVQLTFLRSDGTRATHVVTVAHTSMQDVAVQDLPDMNGVEFSTTIESDQLIVVDRALWWPRTPALNPYGSHAERAILAPSATWYFAEGATHSGFDLFYLLQNPSASSVDVRVRYLRPSGVPLEKSYTLPPLSRTNIWVNNELFDSPGGPLPLLASTDVAAVINVQVGAGIIAERALYRGGPAGRLFEAGHESAGVTAPATDWFFAEGATGEMFDTFILVANPNDTPAQVRATYLLDDGRTFTRDITVGANARTNIWVDVESFDGGTTFPLSDVAFSTTLTSLNALPVIAERSMWWPGPTFATWHEAHNSFGSTETGTRWVAAFGHVPYSISSATYLLIANTTDVAATVQVTLLGTLGAGSPTTYIVQPHSRFNIEYSGLTGGMFTGFFGAIVESVGAPATPIVVERATYSTEFGGTQWTAGTAALLTKIQ